MTTTTTTQNLGIIIVDKTGSLKSLTIKDYKEEELYKKCGFKKPDGFIKQTNFNVKFEGKKYTIGVYAKTDGKANMENKYDFPPPIDTTLFFGSCALICSQKQSSGIFTPTSISLVQWEKMYEKLFGGFEDLVATCAEDDAEIDELDLILAEKKTKNGYLKDGFVVDDSDDSDDYSSEEDDEDSDNVGTEEEGEELVIEDIGSELSEEEYESSSDDEK